MIEDARSVTSTFNHRKDKQNSAIYLVDSGVLFNFLTY